MQKPTLTIGIAAYNEQYNIGTLLRALKQQKVHKASLVEVVVVSDASEDDTDDIVRSFPEVTLLRQSARSGLNMVQERIRQHAHTDILIILDADIIPTKEDSIDTLIAPLIKNADVGLVSAAIVPASPRTFVEKILARNHIFKTNLFQSLRGGNSLLKCFGPARAFSRDFYANITIPDHTPVDAASYLLCKSAGKRFVFAKEASFTFRCPSTLKDHIKQSKRFTAGREAIGELFGRDALVEYQIPKGTLLLASLKEFLLHPVLFIGFMYIHIHTRAQGYSRFSSTWDVALTSKKI